MLLSITECDYAWCMSRSVIHYCLVVLIEKSNGLFEYLMFLFVLNI